MRVAIAPTAARVDKPAPGVCSNRVHVGFPPPALDDDSERWPRPPHPFLGDEILHNFGNSGTAKQQQLSNVSNTVQILQIL